MDFKTFLEEQTPNCPKCGAPMVLRTNGQNGNKFYGCSMYGRTKCPGTMGYKDPMKPKVNKPIPKQPVDIHRHQPPAINKNPWVYATVVKIDARFFPEEKVALQKRLDNTWMVLHLDDNRQVIIPEQEVTSLFQSIKGQDRKPLKSLNPSLKELKNILNPPQKTTTIPDDKISDEQRAIDHKFEQILNGEGQNHIMINALAGTGKSSILKHLAWKYGKPGQKWLYLVFNKKNQVEATESFPGFVDVRTTNAFLGEVLGDKKNVMRIGSTDRTTNLDSGSNKMVEKSRLIADSSDFNQFMLKLGFAEKSNVGGHVAKTMNSLLRGIRYTYKESVLHLVGLAKSFALDPRTESLAPGLDKILNSYDIDTDLIDIKERIAKYNQGFQDSVLFSLNELFGEDFMQKSFKNEVIQGATWMLNELLPNQTKQMHQSGKMQQKLSQYRDFDDDLWYPAINSEKIQWPHYDIVLADEVQDFNEAQKIMLKKLHDSGAKIVAVGDPNQCHPAGTKISINNEETTLIENINVGDELLSYNILDDTFVKRKVIETKQDNYDGEMLTLSTDILTQQCTPNHKCLSQLKETNYYCLYLTAKGNQYKIGTCKSNYTLGFGIHTKSIQSESDKTWLLKTFDSLNDLSNCLCSAAEKFHLPYEFQEIDFEFVKNCLKHYGRLYEYPIWSKDRQITKKYFVTEACNLNADIMLLRTMDKWESFDVKKQFFDGKIYSLKLEGKDDDCLYVANGIVTHNSIYRFRGSDINSFNNISGLLKNLSTDKDTKEFPLTKNFRSRKEILDFANQETHVKNLQAGRTNDDGKVGVVSNGEINYNDVFSTLQQEKMTGDGRLPMQTAFLARTNEPLVQTALKLLASKTPFIIVGKDIAKDLQKHIKKIINIKRLNENDRIQALEEEIKSHLEEEKDSHFGKSTKKAYLQEVEETSQALLSSIEAYNDEANGRGTIGGFNKWISQRLGGLEAGENEQDWKKYQDAIEEQNPVILTTIHKSKGLEFDRVFLLRSDLIPHPKSTRPEDLSQEDNAKFIAYTRAKEELHILNLKGQPGYRDSRDEE